MSKQVTNRQIGDFVIYSDEANVAPFFIRRAGFWGAAPVSGPHATVTEAVAIINAHYKQVQAEKRS